MGLMLVQPAQAIVLPESQGLLSGVSAAMWYPLHGDAEEKSGYGAPDLTVNGAEGALWSAAWGAATPDGAAHYLTAAVGNAVLAELFNLEDIEGEEILLGWIQTWDGALAAAETLLCWGGDVGTAGTKGCWQIGAGTTEQINILTRGAEGTNFVTTTVQNSAMGDSGVYACVLSVRGASASTLDVSLLRWKFGEGEQSAGAATGINLLANSAVGNPGVDASYALTLFARKTTSTTYDRFLGATAGSNAVVGNLWALRTPTPIGGLAEACFADMVANPREFPRSARAV